MSAYSPMLQFVTGLPNSPMTEVKRVVLVRGPWYETPDSLEIFFLCESIPCIPRFVLVWLRLMFCKVDHVLTYL